MNDDIKKSEILQFFLYQVIGTIITVAITFIHFVNHILTTSLFVVDVYIITKIITSIFSIILTKKKFPEKVNTKRFKRFLLGYYFIKLLIMISVILLLGITNIPYRLLEVIKIFITEASSKFVTIGLIWYAPLLYGISLFIIGKSKERIKSDNKIENKEK